MQRIEFNTQKNSILFSAYGAVCISLINYEKKHQQALLHTASLLQFMLGASQEQYL